MYTFAYIYVYIHVRVYKIAIHLKRLYMITFFLLENENKYGVVLLFCADPGANSCSRLLVMGLIIRHDRCYSAGPGTVQEESDATN